MLIEIKIRLDQKQLPYWSARLTHEGEVIVEAVSKTFNPSSDKDFRERFENVTVRLMKIIQESKDHRSIARMLIQEDTKATRPLNKAQGT